MKRLKAEAQRRSEEAARQKGKRSKRGLDKRDSDGRARIGRAIVSGKDGVAGKLSAAMDERLARAESTLSENSVPNARRAYERRDPECNKHEYPDQRACGHMRDERWLGQ